jgi:hypothetical protein
MEVEGNFRELYLGLMIGMPAIGIINSLIFGSQLRNYIASSPRIDAWQDLERFKRIVSAQMYAALAQIGFLIVPYPAFGIGLFTGDLRVADIVYILIPSAILVVVGVIFKQIEAQAKSLPVAEEFREEYQHVIDVWMKKPFPKW